MKACRIRCSTCKKVLPERVSLEAQRVLAQLIMFAPLMTVQCPRCRCISTVHVEDLRPAA